MTNIEGSKLAEILGGAGAKLKAAKLTWDQFTLYAASQGITPTLELFKRVR